MSWLDPIILWFKNGLQLPVHRRVALGAHLTMVEDAANDQLILDGLPPPEGSAPKVVTVSGADHTFNGDGSSGAVKIYPQTILFVHVDGTTATFDFDATAVAEGSTVFFSIEGTDGHVTVRNNAGEVPVPIMLLHTSQRPQMMGIYFDGDDWVTLNPGAGLDSETKVYELTRQLGGDLFHGLAYTQFNGTGLTGGGDFSSGAVGVLGPITMMHIKLSPDGGGSSYHPTIGLGTAGVQQGWVVHMIVDGSSNTSLSVLNGTSGSDPIVDLAYTDFEHTGGGYNAHKRVHSFIFAGSTGTQIDGHFWQRLTPYGSPALV